jgi:pyruvate dehydrogenase E2 component (dihydrolipoamide acetyltransferase)
MADGTFTITNVGPFDVLFSTPVIVYPQVAILGIGKIGERPVFVGDEITKRQLCHFSLTYDHQVIDGAPAASFRETLKQLLGQPMGLLTSAEWS